MTETLDNQWKTINPTGYEKYSMVYGCPILQLKYYFIKQIRRHSVATADILDSNNTLIDRWEFKLVDSKRKDGPISVNGQTFSNYLAAWQLYQDKIYDIFIKN